MNYIKVNLNYSKRNRIDILDRPLTRYTDSSYYEMMTKYLTRHIQTIPCKPDFTSNVGC